MINLQCLKDTMSFYFWDSTLSTYDGQSHHTCSPVLCSVTSLSYWQSRNVCVYYANGRRLNRCQSPVLQCPCRTAECENGLIKPHDNVTCISVCSPGSRQRRRHSVRQEPLVKLISNSFDIHFIASRLQEIRQGVVFAGEIISFLRFGNVSYL